MIKVTDEQIEQWIEDAKKATQGKWIHHKNTYRKNAAVDNSNGELICRMPNAYTDDFEHGGFDAQHIANSCPQNFIVVLEELRVLRGVIKKAVDRESKEIEQDVRDRLNIKGPE